MCFTRPLKNTVYYPKLSWECTSSPRTNMPQNTPNHYSKVGTQNCLEIVLVTRKVHTQNTICQVQRGSKFVIFGLATTLLTYILGSYIRDNFFYPCINLPFARGPY